MIEWFAKNHVAANLLMIGILIGGVLAIQRDIALAFLPDFNLNTVVITTVLPGGNPTSIEQTITSRVEESIADIEGIKEINSRSSENTSIVFALIESGYDEQDILSDVKIRVDSLSTLPQAAERPLIQIAEVAIQVIGLAVYGDSLSYDELYQSAENVRSEILQLEGVTRVGELRAAPREIHIEVAPHTLEQYNLTLADIGTAIQRNSVDISAGNLKTLDGDILIRTNGQAYSANEFREIPITNSGDQVVFLEDVAKVVDGYQLIQAETKFNGESAITFDVFRVGKQSTVEVSERVVSFIDSYREKLPTGGKIATFSDNAAVVQGRLTTLVNSALQGGILVIILLSLFLRPAVALWVGIGIPVCFLGAFAVMPYLGLTLNMLTMFAFIIVLGIVVDDAIVTGENIYRHMRNGMDPQKAAIFGTKEVAVPVTFGVITTMVAFAPLLAVEGFFADFAKQIPLIVIPVLAFSLIESKLILPAHMSTIKARKEEDISGLGRLQQRFSRGFEDAIIKVYRPFLNRCVRNKTITVVCALCVFFIIAAVMKTGWLKSSFAPQFENDVIIVNLSMPATTGYQTTKKYMDHIVDTAGRVAKDYTQTDSDETLFKYIVSVSGLTANGPGTLTYGTNLGIAFIEVEPSENRPDDFSINTVRDRLRKEIGDIPGAEKLSITSDFGDFGRPISIEIFGDDTQRIADRVAEIREYLTGYPGVYDIQDNFSSGKEELQLELTPLANSLGLSLGNVSSQVRQAIFGFEAQRIQRGNDELKVMVRYPAQYRSSLTDIETMPISVTNGRGTVPLSELAQLTSSTSPSAIYRESQSRAVTVSTDVDRANYDIKIIQQELQTYLDDMFAAEPNLSYKMGGQAESEEETTASFLLGFILVILTIYALLAIPFKSFSQPFIVMSIIPLAIIGAIVGHIIMGLAFSMLSVMGILALTGIVVNDSLVLVDYINRKRKEGIHVLEAVLTAGEVRFRPVMLTSLTTFVGLLPLILSGDSGSQPLVPMAVSLGFGILFATLITLVLIPVNYLIFYRLGQMWHGIEMDPEMKAPNMNA